MTAHPIPENGRCWWLVSGKERRLHAIRGYEVTAKDVRAAIDDGRLIPARAVCGLRRCWWMPGLFSRLGRRRCVPCCRALDIPPGYGTPANENDLEERAVVQEDPDLCGWGDCQEPATTALRFRGQPGHVHNCDPHAAINREWSDVIESAPTPNCPYTHGGTWIDYPKDLEENTDGS